MLNYSYRIIHELELNAFHIQSFKTLHYNLSVGLHCILKMIDYRSDGSCNKIRMLFRCDWELGFNLIKRLRDPSSITAYPQCSNEV